MSKIVCILNDRYAKVLRGTTVSWCKEKKKMRDFWTEKPVVREIQGLGIKGTTLLKYNELERAHCPLRCCGISEVHFESLNKLKLKNLYLDEYDFFDEFIAKYIDLAVGHTDRRIVIVGIPTEVGGNSQYRLKFYQTLRKTLVKFGFVELQEAPYKNINSGNKITVLAGQIPALDNIPNIIPDEEELDEV